MAMVPSDTQDGRWDIKVTSTRGGGGSSENRGKTSVTWADSQAALGMPSLLRRQEEDYVPFDTGVYLPLADAHVMCPDAIAKGVIATSKVRFTFPGDRDELELGLNPAGLSCSQQTELSTSHAGGN